MKDLNIVFVISFFTFVTALPTDFPTIPCCQNPVPVRFMPPAFEKVGNTEAD